MSEKPNDIRSSSWSRYTNGFNWKAAGVIFAVASAAGGFAMSWGVTQHQIDDLKENQTLIRVEAKADRGTLKAIEIKCERIDTRQEHLRDDVGQVKNDIRWIRDHLKTNGDRRPNR